MSKPIPLTCAGHTRPVVDLAFSGLTDDGYFMISACKGTYLIVSGINVELTILLISFYNVITELIIL